MTTTELIEAYRTTAIAWDALQNDATKANPVFEQLHTIYKQLRVDEVGRNAIVGLLTDSNVGVRLMAASHSLGWAPAQAVPVLEAIQAEPGLHAVTARYTLKAFRERKLNMDW